MAFVVMNAVDVPPERAAEFEERFAKRAGRVQDSPGFEAFELLKPADGGHLIIEPEDLDAFLEEAPEVGEVLRHQGRQDEHKT